MGSRVSKAVWHRQTGSELVGPILTTTLLGTKLLKEVLAPPSRSLGAHKLLWEHPAFWWRAPNSMGLSVRRQVTSGK